MSKPLMPMKGVQLSWESTCFASRGSGVRSSLAPLIKKYRRNTVFLFAEKEMRIINSKPKADFMCVYKICFIFYYSGFANTNNALRSQSSFPSSARNHTQASIWVCHDHYIILCCFSPISSQSITTCQCPPHSIQQTTIRYRLNFFSNTGQRENFM